MSVLSYCSYVLSDLGENQHHNVTLFSFCECREDRCGNGFTLLKDVNEVLLNFFRCG